MFLSFLKTTFPNCSTAETTFSIPGEFRTNLNGHHTKELGNAAGENRLSWTSAHLETVLTDDLIMRESHDVHGLHRLLEVLLVLLARDGNVTV